MRDFQISDIPTRTGWDDRRARDRRRARIMQALGWVGLSVTMMGIGALIAITSFPR